MWLLTSVYAVVVAVFMASGASAPTAILRSGTAMLVTGALLVTGATRAARRNMALLVGGVASLVAGIGAGVHHAVVAPTSSLALSGIALLLSGLAMVGYAAGRLLRPLRWRHRIWVAPIAGLGIVALCLPLTLAVFVTNAPEFPIGSATPADVGLTYLDVSVETTDGIQLQAWYVPSTNGAALVLLGGCCSARDEQLDNAALLAAHGYGMLLLDTRGHGDSEGDPMLWGWWGETDVRAGVDYLMGRPDVIDGRIGTIGFSVGREQALAAAGADPRIHAVVAEGISARGARDEGDQERGIEGAFIGYVDWASRTAAMMTDAPTPTKLEDTADAMAANQHVLLIAAGTAPAEVAAATLLETTAPAKVDTWVAEGATHTQARASHPTEWEGRVTAFLDATLDIASPN